MKVKVNIIIKLCILMSETVTVPSLVMMTAKHTRTHARTHARTHTHTHRLGVVYVNIFKVAYDFENKKIEGHMQALLRFAGLVF